MTFRFGLLPIERWENQLSEYKKLHNLLFPNTDASLDWIDWYLNDITFSDHGTNNKTRVYSVHDDDKLVGVWCVEPRNFVMQDMKLIKVGRCFSVGIHPDYRRQNLFVELSKFAITCEKELQQYEYVLGFPQVGRPVIDAHIKSGWEFVQQIDMMSFKPVRPNVPATDPNVITNFDEHCCGVIGPQPGSFLHSENYLSRRWIYNPENVYTCIGHNAFGYAVLKSYAGTCHILDLYGHPHQRIKPLLEKIQTLAYRHRWNEITTWCASNDPVREVVEQCGFVVGAEHGSSVELLTVRINAKDPFVLSQCHFSMGSEESY